MHQSDIAQSSDCNKQDETCPPVQLLSSVWIIDSGLALRLEDCIRNESTKRTRDRVRDKVDDSLERGTVRMNDKCAVACSLGRLVEKQSESDHQAYGARA